MKERFYDLSIDTLDDGTIRLEQRDHSGESAILDLHPQQALHISNGLPVGTHQAQSNGAAERIATLERRLVWLRDRFEETYAALPRDFFDHCPEASEFDSWLQASVDVATEFCADFPNATSNALASLQDGPLSPLGSGVSPSATKRNGEHPERCNADLFSDSTGGNQGAG